MEDRDLSKLEQWYNTLVEVSEVYKGNINTSTVIRSLEARIKHFKSKQHA